MKSEDNLVTDSEHYAPPPQMTIEEFVAKTKKLLDAIYEAYGESCTKDEFVTIIERKKQDCENCKGSGNMFFSKYGHGQDCYRHDTEMWKMSTITNNKTKHECIKAGFAIDFFVKKIYDLTIDGNEFYELLLGEIIKE